MKEEGYQVISYDPNWIKDSSIIGNKNIVTTNNTFVIGNNVNSVQTPQQVMENGKTKNGFSTYSFRRNC